MSVSPMVFLGIHFLLFFVCHIMGMICFHHFWINTMVVTFFSCIGIWNGAVYYMDYFCKKYEKQLEELEKMQKDTIE